jgi:hypothetical protein
MNKLIILLLLAVFAKQNVEVLDFQIMRTLLVEEYKNSVIVRGNIPFQSLTINDDFNESLQSAIVNPEYILSSLSKAYFSDPDTIKSYKIVIVNLLSSKSQNESQLGNMEKDAFLAYNQDIEFIQFNKFEEKPASVSLVHGPEEQRRGEAELGVFYKELDDLLLSIRRRMDSGDKYFIYFHCKHGKDRTGALYASYVMKYMDSKPILADLSNYQYYIFHHLHLIQIYQ